MVAEEDYEKTHPASRAVSERQSRPRQRRQITREDVLKINRRHPRRRDISWPPSDNCFRSRSSSEEIHFDECVRKRHEIFHLKEMFDRGTIPVSTTPFAINERNYSRPSHTDEIVSDLDMRSPDDNLGHEMNAHFSGAYQSAKCQSGPRSCRQPEWPPRSYYGEDDVNNNVKLSKKTFYLPETELHIGNIEPIRAYWHNISARSSSTPSRNCSFSIGRDGGGELKRWRSHENISIAHHRNSLSPCNRRLSGRGVGDSHKKDNLPLERNKSNSYNELPPLKPRREDRKDVHHTKKKLNLNNSQYAGRRMWEPVCWIADESLKPNVERQHPAAYSGTSEKLTNYSPNRGQQAHYNSVKSTNRNGTSQSGCNTTSTDSPFIALNCNLYQSSSEQIMKDCAGRKYALNVDHEEKTLLDIQKFRQQPYKSDDMNINQGNKESETKKELNAVILSDDKERNRSLDKYMPYDRGASSMTSHHPATCEGHDQSESLLLKRSLVEEAIAQDVQRISEYMKRAEQEALTADRYANESIAITPLQEILKQIVLPKASTVSGNPYSSLTTAFSPNITVFDPTILVVGMRTENMPVVDQVLVELVALSSALKALDGTSTSAGNNFPPKGPSDAELRSEGNETSGDAIATSADAKSQEGFPREARTEIAPGLESEAEIESEAVETISTSSNSRTEISTPVDKVIHSKNILSGYLITKQSQEEIFEKIHSSETYSGSMESDLGTRRYCTQQPILTDLMPSKDSLASTSIPRLASLALSAIRKPGPSYTSHSCYDDTVRTEDNLHSMDETASKRQQALNIDNIGKDLLEKMDGSLENNWRRSFIPDRKQMSTEIFSDTKLVSEVSNENDKSLQTQTKINQKEINSSEDMNSGQTSLVQPPKSPEQTGMAIESVATCNSNQVPSLHSESPGETFRFMEGSSPAPNIPWRHPNHQYSSQNFGKVPAETLEICEIAASSESTDPINYSRQDYEDSFDRTQQHYSGQCVESLSTARRGRRRTRLDSNSTNRFRSTSQPSSSAICQLPGPLIRQHSLDSSESQLYDSPRLYMSGHFTRAKGYKRVAWPPVDTAPVYATVPQPQNPPPSSYESSQNEYRPQATQAFQPVSHEPSGHNYQAQNYNNYQPQQQQQQQQQQYYPHPQLQRQASPYARGQSPGVIHLRKEPPISQQPAPVYASQPATATLRGGSNMRGDLKWPPPEYKAQAAVENEERRRIAQGPVCRPRRVQKDYSQFFAKNALNHYYPGYKIPPGTQHMYTQY